MLANAGSQIWSVTEYKHCLSMKYFCKSMPPILTQNVVCFPKTTKLCVSIQTRFFTFVFEFVRTITDELGNLQFWKYVCDCPKYIIVH